jgi:hypothetical protein
MIGKTVSLFFSEFFKVIGKALMMHPQLLCNCLLYKKLKFAK